jgi:hypothetical protein
MAGVQNDQIGIIRPIRQAIAMRGQNVRHPFGIIDIHLTAIGFDEQLFWQFDAVLQHRNGG